MNKKYFDLKKVKAAVQRIEKIIEPGTIVVTNGTVKHQSDLIKKASLGIAYQFIKSHQHQLFNKKYRGIWIRTADSWETNGTHVTIYFNDMFTFSAEPPIGMYIPLRQYCLDDIYLLRMTDAKTRTKAYLEELELNCDELYGRRYDIPHLVEIWLSQKLGTKNETGKFSSLFRGTDIVCSVALKVAIDKTNKKFGLPPLFSTIDGRYWTPREIKRMGTDGVDIKATNPAMFMLSRFYGNETELYAHYNDGKRISL